MNRHEQILVDINSFYSEIFFFFYYDSRSQFNAKINLEGQPGICRAQKTKSCRASQIHFYPFLCFLYK